MIQKTVYFRDQADLDLFNAIDNKAEWLHEHLSKQGRPVYPIDDPHPGELHFIPEPTTEPFEPSA